MCVYCSEGFCMDREQMNLVRGVAVRLLERILYDANEAAEHVNSSCRNRDAAKV